MKLSVEAKVAAAVATGFIALTAAAIGQGGSGTQSGVPNNYGPTNNPGVRTQLSPDAEGNRQTASDRDVTRATSQKSTDNKTARLRKQHREKQTWQNESTKTKRTRY